MFTKARLKLTAWYLIIIMTVSLSFSAFIFQRITSEFSSRLTAIEARLELRKLGFMPPPGHHFFLTSDINEAKKQVLFILGYTNLTILIFSSLAGYFLAGKTLSPIEQALEKQKRFVSDAGHELKTPLTALHTSIEVALRDKSLSLREAKSLLKSSLTDIQKLGLLANDLLLISKNDSINNSSSAIVDSQAVIKAVIRKFTPVSKKKRITIKKMLTPVSVKVNPENLEKITSILLDNAIKYTPEGGRVTVRTNVNRKNFILTVSDTGIGINKKDLPHIFDRFYRSDPSRSNHNVAGFGLGLSIAKQIIERSKGTITVSSTPKKGTVFIVKLPLA